MSDVPELDKLLEEHENVKINLKWLKRERAFRLFLLLNIISVILLLGNIGLFFPIIGILSSLTLAIKESVSDLFEINPKKIDLTKRYNYK